MVSYTDDRANCLKQKIYSPSRNEIQVLAKIGLTTVAVPATHNVVSADTIKRTSESAVFALLPQSINASQHSLVWTPAVTLVSYSTHFFGPSGKSLTFVCNRLLKCIMDIEFVL